MYVVQRQASFNCLFILTKKHEMEALAKRLDVELQIKSKGISVRGGHMDAMEVKDNIVKILEKIVDEERRKKMAVNDLLKEVSWTGILVHVFYIPT